MARVIRDRHRAEGSYPALITTTVTMLDTAVFPEAQAWQQRHYGDQLIAQINTLWEHNDPAMRPPPPPLPDDLLQRLVSLRNWSVRQLTGSGSLDRAITLGRTVHTDCRQLLGEEHLDSMRSTNNLASAYKSAKWLVQAIPLLEQTYMDSLELFGEDHPDTLTAANNLMSAYYMVRQLEVPILLRISAEHPNSLLAANNFIYTYYESARLLEQAIPLLEQTLADRRQLLGENHPDALASANDLASAYVSAGRLEQAIPLYEQSLTNYQRVLGEEHPLSQAVAADLQRATTATDGPPRRRWWRTRGK